jgi:hypothetical protein
MAKFVKDMEVWDICDYSSSDDELDFMARKEDYSFLKFHKIKKFQSMVQPRNSACSAPMKTKKKSSVHIAPEKVYKDLEVKYEPKGSSKNNLNILMFGSSGSGKSTICGQFMI